MSRVWDSKRRLMISVLDCNEQALCTTFSPDGQYLAVGLTTGRVCRSLSSVLLLSLYAIVSFRPSV